MNENLQFLERRASSSAGGRSALEEMKRRQEMIREQREKLRQVKQEERANLLRARNPSASAAATLDATGLPHNAHIYHFNFIY